MSARDAVGDPVGAADLTGGEGGFIVVEGKQSGRVASRRDTASATAVRGPGNGPPAGSQLGDTVCPGVGFDVRLCCGGKVSDSVTGGGTSEGRTK